MYVGVCILKNISFLRVDILTVRIGPCQTYCKAKKKKYKKNMGAVKVTLAT